MSIRHLRNVAMMLSTSVFSSFLRGRYVRQNVSWHDQEYFQGVFVWFWYVKFVIIALVKLLGCISLNNGL